jgi:F-type H+-transporting ATPase subunit b
MEASGIAKLGINWQSMLLYFVNFGVLFFVLRHFLGKKVLVLLDERRNRIAESVEAADRLKKEVEQERGRLAEEMHELRTQFAYETLQMRKGLEEERAKALAHVEEYRAQALAQVEAEAKSVRARMFSDMQEEIRSVVAEMTLRILGDRISSEDIDRAAHNSRKSV